MVASQSLQDQLATKVNEVVSLVEGLDDSAASKSPREGEWCAKEVLSHLIGPELGAWKGWVESIATEDTPTIDLTPGISYYEPRRSFSVGELIEQFKTEYGALGDYFAGLSEDQLSRKAHVPLFKETPLGEYPTLDQFAGGIINFHMADHVQQLRSLCE